ncbi:ABC transporter ATP-binding protein [Geopsychrobacter electrodiphilus]|uniref:ABC transporter ATP-binding protein n=1 Tax=Geopsychrobacter electrodiphilus TaxID=225196 RepID=UPI00036FE11D|nr:ABC transporter ATP-binding protein [Geopsychrobacter electrodiphilus]
MSLLKIERLNAGYGDIQVLFDLSLEVRQGEVLSIIGANGVGKTTLLKTISGLMKSESGSIRFKDQEIQKLPPEEIVSLGIAQIPEGRRLFTLMSVLENLEMGAYTPRARPHKDETLQEVYRIFPRLQEREAQLAGTLSGGEQQMVAIGRGIMARPEVMMFDEPSLGLSPVLREETFRVVRRIAETGVTVVLVEQDVKHSLSISDRAYVMERGQVVLEGTGAELLVNPHVRKAYLGI